MQLSRLIANTSIALASLAASLCLAATPPAVSPIDVVKIISFDCSVCYQAESLDPPIRQAVAHEGGRFVIAPLPRADSQARERFYYVLRDLSPEIEQKTRNALFRGTQDLNYPLSDSPQTLDFLSQDMASLTIDWDAVVLGVNSDASGQAVQRAILIAAKSGAQITPTYVLIRDGAVIATLDINSNSNTSLSALREAVLNALQSPNSKAKR